MSIYEDLLALGYTDSDIRQSSTMTSLAPRTFGLAVVDTPDGIPLVGVSYRCDYRCEEEEEEGQGKVGKALGIQQNHWVMDPARKGSVSHFADRPSLIVSIDYALQEEAQVWGKNITSIQGISLASGTKSRLPGSDGKIKAWAEDYDEYYRHALSYAQRMPENLRPASWKTIRELKDIAIQLGIPGRLPTKKIDLIESIQGSKQLSRTALQPNIWPGWFHTGNVLVLTAEHGIAADTLNLLYKASQEGTLAHGGGKGAFSTGVGFYDGKDVGSLLQKERDEHTAWFKEQMDALQPVKATLIERGHGFYFLGNPTMIQGKDENTPTLKYYLNGNSANEYGKQPYGWYTLDELLAEKFLEDLKERISA